MTKRYVSLSNLWTEPKPTAQPMPWVKKLGQWHLSGGNGETLCGSPMLGNNYAKYIPEEERTKCDKCFAKHFTKVVKEANS